MATTRVVLGGCRSSDDGPLSIRDRTRLTERIVGFYRTAAGRLPSGNVLHGGFCFGILDPIANIVANAITSGSEATESSVEAMARRSVDGLVAFLVSYFRYLPPDEALRYLRAAKADLCAAVRDVESDRCTQAFRVDSGTARTAFRCAALAMGHPDPDHLVTATPTIFYHRHQVQELLLSQPGGCLSADAVNRLRQILNATSGLPDRPPSGLPGRAQNRPRFGAVVPSSSLRLAALTCSLNRALLNRIHCFYLEALALLPLENLRKYYHRSLVIAGHCYGPLDPVSNIILNTVWLEATFPVRKEQQFELPMISSLALLRVAHRSLEGMVAFLRAFAGGDLSDLDAYRFLLHADANLGVAMKALKQAQAECDEQPKGGHPTIAFSDIYQAAVTASMHPRPDMLRDFLASDRVHDILPAYSGRSLSHDEVCSLIISLSETKPSFQDDGLPLLPAKYLRLPQMTRDGFILNKDQFQREFTLFSRMVDGALKKYTQHNGGTEYELVFICGGNENVADQDGPELSQVDYPWSPFKYHYCHVNFLARPKGINVAPTLFFAECVKYEETSDLSRETTCCPVVVPPKDAAEELRCYYCEFEGTSIVHPTERSYHGCKLDFEKMVLGNNVHKTDKIVYNAKTLTDFMGLLPVDYVYFDPGYGSEGQLQVASSNADF